MLSSILLFGKIAAKDFFKITGNLKQPDQHLNAAIGWLSRANDMSPDNGVSYGYSILKGWRPSYIETSGYIVTTFFNLSKRINSDFHQRAVKIADWLVSVQNSNGSFSNRYFNSDDGIVFDTGQDLFGLIRAYTETGSEYYLDSAIKAGDWLVSVSDDQGRWTRNTHLGIPHVYNTRTAWALIKLFKITSNNQYLAVAEENLQFAMEQENNGWFDKCAFEEEASPFTHTIAYAIRGLLESGILLNEPRFIDIAKKVAISVRTLVDINGFIPGQIDIQGKPTTSYSCLTGNCQMSIIWYLLYGITNDEDFLIAANKTMRFVMSCQVIESSHKNIKGAIKGSQPVYGKYSPFTFPNWATKFFIDAMIYYIRFNNEKG